ncbi:hypothetical protein ACP70R_024649 [Stipagrostis hirtigluma subsp. patula]
MATLHHQQHIIKAPTPTWFLIRATPPARDGGGGKKSAASAACSPLILSPSVWEKALSDKKGKIGGRDDAGGRVGGLPASPRISCMGQVKGRSSRRGSSSSARGAAATGSRRGGGKVARLVLGLFGRRGGRTSSRACAKVMDVPSGSGTASAPGSSRATGAGGAGGCAAAVAVGVLDPPLPVVRRPARVDDVPSLWERRRGGKALEGLRLTS